MLPSLLRRAFAIGAGVCLSAAIWAETPGIDPERYLEHVKYLSSPEMAGRGAGSEALDRAAEYIADEFRSSGLRSPRAAKRYLDEFDISVNASLGEANRFVVRSGQRRKVFEIDRDYAPLSFSSRGEATGSLVFAGYGITAPEYSYDDYADIDVSGKIVVILNHEPQEYDRSSIFAGKIYTEHSQMFSKAMNATMHGALAILLVNDTDQHGGSSGDLTQFSSLPGPAAAGVPFVHVGAGPVKEWFRAAGRDFDDIQAEINRNLQPRSFAFPEDLRVSLRTDVRNRRRPIYNVAGYLPGKTNEHVIVGAHYDHIGHGEQFSMRPSAAGTIHPGADDNASGTAGLIELARWFADREPMRRGVLFLGFAGEELGLLGSSHYVRRPLLPIEDAVAMINMDMIGRIRDGRVYVGGSSTGSGLREMLERRSEGTVLNLDLSDTVGYGSSDHTAFTTRGIPVLFFFSGLHGDYHRPGDTWDKIKPDPTAALLRFIAGVVTELASGDRPIFMTGSVAGSAGILERHSGRMLTKALDGVDE